MDKTQDWQALIRQDPPRKVPASVRAAALHGARRRQLSLAAGVIVCAVIFAISFPWVIIDDILLDVGAVDADGVVIASERSGRSIGDGVYLRNMKVYQVRFREMPPAEPVTVEYLPNRPSLARIKGGFFVPGGYWEVAWAAIFIVLPLIGIWTYRDWRRRRLALLVNGEFAPGRIERVWRDQHDEDTQGCIEVAYEAPNGVVRLRRTVEQDVYRRAREIFRAEVPVRVLHDRRAAHEHIVLELMD
jgi:hypothetical protein